MTMSTHQPVYLVLGATGGIGSALSRRLASQGARLVLGARNPEKLQALETELGASSVSLDVHDSDAVDRCVARTLELHDRVDGIAHCVGSLLLKATHLTSNEEWMHALNTNLTSAFYVVRAASKAMRRTGGSIVLMTSAAARVGLANHEAIAAAKAGVIGLTLSAAATYATRGIRVNCVAPGLTRTPLTAPITNSDTAMKASVAMHPLGRAGEADEVASAIAWFLNPEQHWVTGQVLGVDGGLANLKLPSSA